MCLLWRFREGFIPVYISFILPIVGSAFNLITKSITLKTNRNRVDVQVAECAKGMYEET